MMVREIGVEKLDGLSPSHPHAIANRKDLHRINRLLGTNRWFERVLPGIVRPGIRILELGAGDGAMSDFLRRRLNKTSSWQWHALDIQQVPGRIDDGLQWHQADLLQFDEYESHEVVFGNFILHQFDRNALKRLGERLHKGTRALVFQELWRKHAFYWSSFLLTLFMHKVTRHDARVSVRAGFQGEELADLLGLNPNTWKVSVEYSLLGTYRMVALRI
jgi:hypothetical protein